MENEYENSRSRRHWQKRVGCLLSFWGLHLFLRVNACRRGRNQPPRLGPRFNHKYHVALERSFYKTLSEKTGHKYNVNYNPLDVVGVNMKDTLRLARKGTFDIVEATVGKAAGDDPFLEGFDLIGVSPSLVELKKAINAYRDVFSKRVEKKFNIKVMTLWPYGPQVFYCKPKITGLKDFKGLKIRTYTPSMSALIQTVGGTPVTLSFKEVYPGYKEVSSIARLPHRRREILGTGPKSRRIISHWE